jgi:hypothetical protein
MDKTLRRVTNIEEQDAENYRYWQSRPMFEVMQAVAEIVYTTYAFKGIDLNAQRPDGTLTRVQRPSCLVHGVR